MTSPWLIPLKTASDDRLVQVTLNISIKFEQSPLIKSMLRPIHAQIQNPESFQLELQNCIEIVANSLDVDHLNNKVVNTIRIVESKYFKARRK